jgi:hypothetical protein
VVRAQRLPCEDLRRRLSDEEAACAQALLAEAHRTLRVGGRLVIETPNPASALSFHDMLIRDLTHERPLHPETLR